LAGINWRLLVADRLNSHGQAEDGAFAIEKGYVRRLGSDPEGSSYFLVPALESFAPSISHYCLLRLSPRARARQRHLEGEDRKRGLRVVLAAVSWSTPFPLPINIGDASPAEVLRGSLETATLPTRTSPSTWVLGVTPDSVASMSLRFSGGSEITAATTEDFWLITVPGNLLNQSGALIFRDSARRVIKSSPWAI
jgi:hypothetical protein